MATNNKDFRIKNGLIVDGANATVNGNNVLTTASTIDNLSDVTITTPSSGQVLKWNGSAWVNDTDSTGGTGSGLPTGGTTGQILAKNSSTDGDAGWIDNYAEQVKHTVKASETLTKGQPVYVSSATGANILVSKASNTSEATSSKTLGLIETDVATNEFSYVVTEGIISGLDLSSETIGYTVNEGDPVWLGESGGLIYGLSRKPYAPAHLVYIGVVTRVQTNNGQIYVKPQNGFELNELHDVGISNTASYGDIIQLQYDGIWRNVSIFTANIANLAASSNYFAGDIFANNINLTSDIHSNTITTTGVADVATLYVGRHDAYWNGMSLGNPSQAMSPEILFFSSGYGNYYDAKFKITGGTNGVDGRATLGIYAGTVDFQSNVTFAAANVIGNITLDGGNISGVNKFTATTSVKTPSLQYYGTGNTASVYPFVDNVQIGIDANIISIGDYAFNTGTTVINNDLKISTYIVSSDGTPIYKEAIDTFGKVALTTTFRGIFTGDGSNLTSINANNVSSGTISSDRLPLANATANGIVNISSQTFSGDKTFNNNVSIAGNLTVTGTTTTVSATNLEISDPLIYIGTGNSSNLYDLGVVGHFNDGTYQHTGIVRDATDGIWKFFSNVTTEPTGNTALDFTNAVYDTVKVGNVSAVTNVNAATVNVTGQLISTVATGTAPLAVTSTTKVTNLNADLLDGYNSDTGITANTVVVRDSNSSISVNNINLGAGTFGNVSADYLKLVSGYDLNITAGAAVAGNIRLNSNTTYTTHAAGTNNNTLATTAYVDAAITAGGLQLKFQSFGSNVSVDQFVTNPPGLVYAVLVGGGGGGGAGSATSAGGGGGAGCIVSGWVPYASALTLGSGGAAGSAGIGGTGGITRYSTLQAYGGIGGGYTTTLGTVSGYGQGAGGGAGTGTTTQTGPTGNIFGYSVGGNGGNGVGAAAAATATAGSNATSGGGGGGAYTSSTTTGNPVGGAGGSGAVGGGGGGALASATTFDGGATSGAGGSSYAFSGGNGATIATTPNTAKYISGGGGAGILAAGSNGTSSTTTAQAGGAGGSGGGGGGGGAGAANGGAGGVGALLLYW